MKNLKEKIDEELICGRCLMLSSLCLCSLIPSLKLDTKISLVIHHFEMNRSSNTGRLALEALTNSEMRVRGREGETLDLSDLLTDDYETLLLYPSENSIELCSDYVNSIDKKIQLIVPDGNWRQTRKVFTRQKELRDIKKVMISRKQKDAYYMRNEHLDNGMATLQAIAMALGVIEGEEVQEKLLDLYYEKVNRTREIRSVFNPKL